jgi:phosphatidylglycerol:prolipoprotein diacylglycerol transferase
LYIVLRHLSYFAADPVEIFLFWKGGLASSGAIIGGLGAAVLLARLQRLPMAAIFDCCAPSIALTIVLGRIGCFLNGCCYGSRTEIFWAMRFPPGSGPHYAHLQSGLISADQLSLPVHPTQLYEAGYALIVLLVLLKWRRRLSGNGRLFALLFVLYPLGRFANEFLRADDRVFFFGWSFPQWLALMSMTAAVLFLVVQANNPIHKSIAAEINLNVQ